MYWLFVYKYNEWQTYLFDNTVWTIHCSDCAFVQSQRCWSVRAHLNAFVNFIWNLSELCHQCSNSELNWTDRSNEISQIQIVWRHFGTRPKFIILYTSYIDKNIDTVCILYNIFVGQLVLLFLWCLLFVSLIALLSNGTVLVFFNLWIIISQGFDFGEFYKWINLQYNSYIGINVLKHIYPKGI